MQDCSQRKYRFCMRPYNFHTVELINYRKMLTLCCNKSASICICLRSNPSVRKRSRVRSVRVLSKRIWYAMLLPYSSSVSNATRRANAVAAIRRGCVHAIRSKFASSRYCGTWFRIHSILAEELKILRCITGKVMFTAISTSSESSTPQTAQQRYQKEPLQRGFEVNTATSNFNRNKTDFTIYCTQYPISIFLHLES